jgi:hypothetical protein
MANIQISGLTAVSSLTSGDVFALDQSVGNLSKKITTANLATAIVTTINVTSAGALMDSEITNLAQVKAFDSADYATAAQGITADAALPKTGGAMTGAITTTSTFDGRDVAADGTKLDGIEALADVTDATNIAAAGGVIPTGTPDGTKFLRDDQVWTAVPAGGVSIGDNIGGAGSMVMLFTDVSGNLTQNTKLTFSGNSLNFTGASTSANTCSSFGTNAGNGNGYSLNVSIGYQANRISTGSGKAAVGVDAGYASTGNDGAFLGTDSGKSSGGNRNNYIGYRCGMNRGTGASNNAQGDYSLFAGSGVQNTAMGSSSQNSIVGSYNTSIGSATLSLASGSNNTVIGFAAGQSLVASDVLALGYYAGKSNTQSNRTIIGQSNLPVFAGEAAAAAALPVAGVNGVFIYWDSTDNTIKARP